MNQLTQFVSEIKLPEVKVSLSEESYRNFLVYGLVLAAGIIAMVIVATKLTK